MTKYIFTNRLIYSLLEEITASFIELQKNDCVRAKKLHQTAPLNTHCPPDTKNWKTNAKTTNVNLGRTQS